MSGVPFLSLADTYAELKPQLDAAFARVMASGWYVRGAELEGFEKAFAAYCGVAHAVGVGNGLDALSLVFEALGIGEGDEVIVPAHTFIASWLGVTAARARVLPVDVRRGSGNLDPTLVEAALTPRTRAVLAVHLYGQPAELDALAALCRRRGLVLLEDAAQAHGARVRIDGAWRAAGSVGRAAGFSFYPGKNLGAYGDGGAVTSDDAALADAVRRLGNYGSRQKYVHDVAGHNSRLDELQAALLAARLGVLDEWNARRRAIAAVYQRGLAAAPRLTLPEVVDGCEPVWHLYVVRHPARDALQRALTASGVGTLIHYPEPPHLSGAYAHLGLGRGRFPVAEELAATVLSLPIGPHLAIADAERVVEEVVTACRTLG